jgi:transketolase
VEAVFGMTTLGASAPLEELQKKFGFTVGGVVDAARKGASLTRQRTSAQNRKSQR